MHPASSTAHPIGANASWTRRARPVGYLRRGGRGWSVLRLVVTTLALGALALASCAPIGQASDRSHAATRPLVPTPTATATPSPTPDPAQLPGWTLIWRDEFDELDEFADPSLDVSKWTIVSDAPGGYHHCCLGNTGNAWIPDDVSIVDGSLRLTTERRNFQGSAYTSGAVTTQGKFDFLYGRLDIRARVPRGNGLWPAFWLLPSDLSGSGYASFEIDMMEALGQDPHTDYMVNWVGTQHVYCEYTGPDFSADYHVYSFIWSASSMSWLIDGTERCARQQGIPDVRMNLTLNTRIGGSWPVPPDASTVLPQYTDIDYVRVYSAAA